MKKWIRVLGWIVIWASAVFFIQSGFQKLTGMGEMVDLFYDLGYSDGFRIAVGWFEVIGALLLVVPR